jgi:hypothetical protein
VAVGAWFLAGGLAKTPFFRGVRGEVLELAALVGLLAAFAWIPRYYARRFGRIDGPSEWGPLQAGLWGAIALAAILTDLSLEYLLEAAKLPVSLLCLVTAACLAVIACVTRWRTQRLNALAAAGLALGLGFLPALGVNPVTNPAVRLALGTLAIGVGFVTHRRLVRTLDAVSEEADGRPV